MNTEVMFSSKTDDWATPLDFFKELDKEFHFDLDPCSDQFNHKCERFFTKAENGLEQSWGGQEFSAILPTAERFPSGFRSLSRRAKSPIPS